MRPQICLVDLPIPLAGSPGLCQSLRIFLLRLLHLVLATMSSAISFAFFILTWPITWAAVGV